MEHLHTIVHQKKVNANKAAGGSPFTYAEVIFRNKLEISIQNSIPHVFILLLNSCRKKSALRGKKLKSRQSASQELLQRNSERISKYRYFEGVTLLQNFWIKEKKLTKLIPTNL